MTAVESLRARITARVGRLSLDLSIETGPGVLVIVGPNGAGKTSLLSLLLGALPIASGRVEVGSTVLFDSALSIDVPLECRRLGYVPQDYALFPHLNVRQNVELSLSVSPFKDRAARATRLNTVFRDFGLDAFAERSPHTLSGGEKQRVALARALSVGPRALLLDEPLAALDVHSRREVRGFLASYLEHLELPTVVVTHDPTDAKLLGRRIAVLEAGRITQTGAWKELVARPASHFVAAFVSTENTEQPEPFATTRS